MVIRLELGIEKRRKNTEILYFPNSVAIENCHTLKKFAKTQSN